jgi:hypothetical protein
MSNAPPILPGCTVLPPLEPEPPRRHQAESKPKGKRSRRHTADRFGVLNAFTDCTLATLPRNDLAVWLVLWRDTRNGTACTAQTDLARRTGVSVRTVKRAIGRLRRCGLLVRICKGGLNRGPSRYRVEPLRTDRHKGQAGVTLTGAKLVSP